MKSFYLSVLIFSITSSAYAGPVSMVGAKPMTGDTAHHAGVGWPSAFYEWWHAGNPDWAIGGEIVYGDWVGEFSDVEIGGAINLPMRWHISRRGITDVAFRLSPGVLIANSEAAGNDFFTLGVRGEVGLPISIDVHRQVNLLTGAVVPASVLFVESIDAFAIIPILARIGVEVDAVVEITPYFLLELGPAIAVGDFGTEVEFAVRVLAGTTFW